MNILIYRTGRLGDFLVAVPAIRLIRKAYPAARIYLLTCASTNQQFAKKTWAYADPAVPLPWLDFVVPNPIDEVIMLGPLGEMKGLSALRRKIKQRRFVGAFFLPFTAEPFKNRLKKWVFLRLMGVKCPIWGLLPKKGNMFAALDQGHQVITAIDAARQSPQVAKHPYSEEAFGLNISNIAKDWVEIEFQKRNWNNRRIVAVFAGGTYAHKRWLPENFAATCKQLAVESDVAFVLVGSESERRIAEPIFAALKDRCWNSCGATNIHQLAAIIERSSLFLGNDSGPAHLSAAVGTPCVTLISSIHDSGVWDPWGKNTIALRHAVPCANCRSETICPVGTEACIRGIAVADAVAACRKLLAIDRLPGRNSLPSGPNFS